MLLGSGFGSQHDGVKKGGRRNSPALFCFCLGWLGDGAGAEVGGVGTVVGTEGEAVGLDECGAVDGGPHESPCEDCLAGPAGRCGEGDTAGATSRLGHQALSHHGAVDGDIDGVLSVGARIHIGVWSEGDADAGGFRERGRGEHHRGHSSL